MQCIVVRSWLQFGEMKFGELNPNPLQLPCNLLSLSLYLKNPFSWMWSLIIILSSINYSYLFRLISFWKYKMWTLRHVCFPVKWIKDVLQSIDETYRRRWLIHHEWKGEVVFLDCGVSGSLFLMSSSILSNLIRQKQFQCNVLGLSLFIIWSQSTCW